MENEAILTGIEPEETEAIEPKLYSFRPLKSTDVFLMSKIISKIGINEFTKSFEKDEIKKMIASFTDNKEETEGESKSDSIASAVGLSVALEIANIILGNLPKCEKEIMQLLASVSGKDVKTIENLDAVVFLEMVVDFVKKEEFKDFIKVASKLFK